MLKESLKILSNIRTSGHKYGNYNLQKVKQQRKTGRSNGTVRRRKGKKTDKREEERNQ